VEGDGLLSHGAVGTAGRKKRKGPPRRRASPPRRRCVSKTVYRLITGIKKKSLRDPPSDLLREKGRWPIPSRSVDADLGRKSTVRTLWIVGGEGETHAVRSNSGEKMKVVRILLAQRGLSSVASAAGLEKEKKRRRW